MFANTVTLGILLALTALLITSIRRAWRSSRAAIKWSGTVAASLFTLIFAFASVASARGMFLAYAPRGSAPPTLTVERTPERVARGEHIARALCSSCHSTTADVPLTGGKNLSEEAHMPLGDIVPFNLTPGGPLKTWSDGEIFRAVRNAADRDRHPLVVMSGQGVRNLSDDDVHSVIAYLRSQAPVESATAPERLSFISMIFAGAGMLPLDLSYRPEHIAAPAKGPTAEYGQYVVGWAGCKECHGAELTGGGGGVLPKGPNLRVVKGWTRDQFIQTIRSGVDPFGKKLDPMMMPWKFLGRMDDDELSAVHAYLTSLPAQTVAMAR
jgi:mono/diheme cytochrome c family protein